MAYTKDINRDNFNPVAVMVAIDTIDNDEIKRLLEEACYHIANLHNQLNRYQIAVEEIAGLVGETDARR